jgi:gephyrin
MGEFDLVKPYMEAKGEVFFGRLNMKPGKPTTFGRVNDCLCFGLPGNPVSCFVTSHLFVVPAAKMLSGHTEDVIPMQVNVKMIPNQIKLDPIRPEYHRVTVI